MRMRSRATLLPHFMYGTHVRVRQTHGWGQFHYRYNLHPLQVCIRKRKGICTYKFLDTLNTLLYFSLPPILSHFPFSFLFFFPFSPLWVSIHIQDGSEPNNITLFEKVWVEHLWKLKNKKFVSAYWNKENVTFIYF